MAQKSEFRISRGHGLIFEESDVITISSGAADLEDVDFSATVTVAAESGTADDLTDINNGFTNQVVILKADTGDTITVKTTGNINISSDFDLTATGDRLALIYNGTGWDPVTGGGGGSSSGIGSIQSYTPEIGSLGTNPTWTYNTQTGRYKYIGEDLVWFYAYIDTFGRTGPASGAMTISLPVTGVNNESFPVRVETVDWNAGIRYYLVGSVLGSALTIQEISDNGSSTRVSVADFNSNAEFYVSGCYEV